MGNIKDLNPHGEMKYKYTVALDSQECIEPLKVGAKALRLAEMAVKNYPVPKGFVITADAFIEFGKYNNLIDLLKNAAYSELPAKIIAGELPDSINSEIKRWLDVYSFDEYAVRSSSTSEDSTEHSMAGQFDTFLCVKKTAIQQKIKECWASMFNDAVIAYAGKNGITVSYKMGVIVQEQIHPLLAGVLFTMDPLTKSTDHIIVEWVDGLGDKLVSGEVTPERMYISRISQVIPSTSNVPAELENSFIKLVGYVLKAEKEFNHPVDMEWCIDDKGESIVLQARPITGFTEDNVVIWTNVNMTENFPCVLTPFTWSVIDNFYKVYAQGLLRIFGWSEKRLSTVKNITDNLTGIHAGRIYYNMSNWYEVMHLSPVGKQLSDLINSFLGQNIPFTFKPKSPRTCDSSVWSKPLAYLNYGFHLFKTFITAEAHLKRYEKVFYQKREIWRQQPYEKLSLEQLVVTLDALFYGILDRYSHNEAIVDLHAALFPGGLKLLLKKWFPKPEENMDLLAVQLMQGLDVKSVEPMDMMREIAVNIMSDNNLQKLLVDKKYEELEKKLDGRVKELFDVYMDKFGGRCFHDSLIVSPTFEERHEMFWDIISKLQRSRMNEGAEQDKSLIRKQATQKVSKMLPLHKRLAFTILLRNAHAAVRRREICRIIRSLTLGEIRQIALAMGKKLKLKGYLAEYEDVFYLQWNEIADIAYGKFQFPELIGNLIAARKKAFEENNKGTTPDFFITEKSEYFKLRVKNERTINFDLTKLRGVAISGGSIKARARIILDPVKDNQLEPGEILVAKATDPGWTPLFRIAGGLIIEKGGMLSHGAIVAREFGIPAVAGIEDATSIIKDGELLELNGDLGEVNVLEKKALTS